MQKLLNLFHHDRQAASVTKVFHEVIARRLQIQNVGHVAAQFFKVVNGEVDVQSARNGNQVNDGIGRATNGGQSADGIFKSLTR